jgi:hypothetical protein
MNMTYDKNENTNMFKHSSNIPDDPLASGEEADEAADGSLG